MGANWSTFYRPFNIGNPGAQDLIRADQYVPLKSVSCSLATQFGPVGVPYRSIFCPLNFPSLGVIKMALVDPMEGSSSK